MNKQPASLSEGWLLEREAGGDPYVAAAIEYREQMVDKIVEQGGATADSEEFRRFVEQSKLAESHKRDAGVVDPEPFISVKTDKQ